MKANNKLCMLLLFAFVALSMGSCKKLSSYKYETGSVNIYQVIASDVNNFSVFQYAIDRSGMAATLKTGDYTVFAPTNSVFSYAGITTTSMYAMPLDSLALLVKNHIVKGRLDPNAYTNGQQLTTLSGNTLLVQKIGNGLYVDGGDVTRMNISASNGSINVINKVLTNRYSIIDRLQNYVMGTANNQFTFLLAAIARASQGITDFNTLLGDSTTAYTLFAPNNGAFIDGGYATIAAVQAAKPDTLGKLLLYHMLNGRKLIPDFMNVPPMTAMSNDLIYFDNIDWGGANYTNCYAEGLIFSGGSANMFGGNGVIHSINRFLPRPTNVTTIQRIQSDTTLSMYNAALTVGSQAGKFNFVDMLSNPDSSYTVFAINNNGLRAAGYANVAAITTADPKTISDMLAYSMLYKRMNNVTIALNGVTASAPTLLVSGSGSTATNATLTFFAGVTGGAYSIQGPSNTAGIPVITRNIVTTNGILNIIAAVPTP